MKFFVLAAIIPAILGLAVPAAEPAEGAILEGM